MRRIPIRWLLTFSMALVTCCSFIIAGNLIFSAFARNVWMEYTQFVEMQLHDVLGNETDYNWQDKGPFVVASTAHRPIEFPSNYEGGPENFVRSLSKNGYQVILFDDQRRILARYPYNSSLEIMPPSSVFELLELRLNEYAAGTHVRPIPDTDSKRPSFLHGMFFGPVGIFNIFDGFLYGRGQHNFFVFMRGAKDNYEHNSLPGSHADSSNPQNFATEQRSLPNGGGRALTVNSEASVTKHLNADGISIFCPPDFMRVTYEIPNDCQVFVAPFVRQGQLVGFVEVVSSWAVSKRMLYEFAAQITVIGGLLSLIVIAVSIAVNDWLFKPLETVVETARRVSTGDLSARTGLQRGRNEFYMLGSSFDSMVESLEESFTEQRRFIGDASHELKTPITSLLGVAEVLGIIRQQLGDNPQMDKSLATMKRELERMTVLVRDLLLLSRSSELAMKLSMDPISVQELIDEACQASLCGVMNRTVERNSSGDLFLLGDIHLLTRALRNIIDNALRYTPADKKVSVNFAKIGTEVCIAVVDEGCGIKAENIKDLGKRFYRVDSGRARVSGGTGLGLAITRTIVERHKGRLDISSQEGQGTTVKIYLPLPNAQQLGEDVSTK
ncbi:MAG: HAMP domain-containing sensor histidine kinase [bacterium]|nr:HAMP domain-containing sensor histidine kinase [bacterium]